MRGQLVHIVDVAHFFAPAAGLAELEAMAEIHLSSNFLTNGLGKEGLRVLLAVLRRPLVAGRLVSLYLA